MTKGLILSSILIILRLYIDGYVYKQADSHISLSKNHQKEGNIIKRAIIHNKKSNEILSVSHRRMEIVRPN